MHMHGNNHRHYCLLAILVFLAFLLRFSELIIPFYSPPLLSWHSRLHGNILLNNYFPVFSVCFFSLPTKQDEDPLFLPYLPGAPFDC